MSALLIALCVGTLTVQSIFTKQYSLKGLSGDYTFGASKVLFAFLFFLVTTKDLSITAQILPYSLGFAAAYTAAIVTTIFAIKTGPLAISSLILSYSLIIPTMYGFLFGLFVFAGYSPLMFFLPLATFLLVLYLTKIIALASIFSAMAVTGYTFFTVGATPVFFALVAFTVIIVIRHRKNIERIINHEENKITWM
jgi:hypothetical protein